MRIRRLDITGFKSFMDRSVFTFDDGVTGIVGPNGCGKSNVVDAIRWVMGEQSAKNLRGRGMEDVIFNGSELHAPLSMSEVTLTFKVDEGDLLAPQYVGLPEVSVTRRLFRSGESEYLINKTTCRLLDVTELFLGTGVGTRAYSIIEQGRVGMIVSAKPEERRAFIEEAAGVTKYKARRKAAERKMEYTQQNLLRVTDLVGELERRLDSLQRQAKKAEKYKKLKAEMREIELHSASHRFLELHAERKVLEARLSSLGSEEKEALAHVHALEDSIAARRAALEVHSAELESLATEVHLGESQAQLDEQNLVHWKADAEGTARRIDEAANEVGQLEERAQQLRFQISTREEEQRALGASQKEDEVALHVLQEELRRVTALQAELAQHLDEERGLLVELAGKLANHESNLSNLARRKGELEARRSKLSAEAEGLAEEERRLSRLRDEVVDRVGQLRQSALDLAARKGQEEEALVKTREAFAENEIQVICLREELADKRSRLTSLWEIQKNYEGYDRGVRAVMLKAGEQMRKSGIFGLVADVLSAPPEYEKAIEAALGEKLQHVIVESRHQALKWVEELRSVSEGRSSFLPLPAPREGGLADVDLNVPGAIAPAWREVKCEEALTPVVQALLGDVLIVRDLEVARTYPPQERPVTLVTLEGEVLRADGSVTGGVLEGPAVGALQKKREISELTEEVARVEARYNDIVTRHYSLQKQMGHSEGVLKGLAKHQHAEELSLATQEKDLHKAGEDLSKLRERIAVLELEKAQMAEGLAALAVEEEAARGELVFGQTDRDGREERVRQMALEVETLKAKGSSLTDELTALRVKVAAAGEKAEAAKKEVEQLVTQGVEVDERLAKLGELVSEGSHHLEELHARTAQTELAREERAGQLAQRKAELEAKRAAYADGQAQVREEDGAVRELRGKLDGLAQGLSQISLRERELTLELEHLLTQTFERHQTELAHELHRFHLLPSLPKETELRLKDLRAQVERMGEVNLTAIEEHQEISTRYEFLATQKRDLESSLAQLKAAIVKIDKTSRERFSQTFEVVNEKFQQIFPRLFGGGRAGLVLTEDPAGGEPGVEIVAQPPGKKLQSVTLLSGGEKALTAVALIFAIFLIKPTPFCLLDEVDAPLDEANVGRYNEMVREMAKQSQFILITHNKRTMEVVDTLYGVTMEEPGVSKLVSVKMHEAVAANTDQVA
ncbi:MAG: chromosome segregation protein SMC [Myxococcota bacterium]